MNITRDIHNLSDFKQNASKLVKQVQETQEPIVVTVNGKPAAVLQDAESYQRMADATEYQETVAAIRLALQDIDNAKDWPAADEVFADLRKRYGISRRKK